MIDAKNLIYCGIVTFVLATSPAAAQVILGTWLSPPDGKKQTGHVEVRRCGKAFCGTMVRTFDQHGNPITTKNTGRKLIWDFIEVTPGTYRDGLAYLPIMNMNVRPKIDVTGDRLVIRGCIGPVCKKQIWIRLH